jgi:outer membrane protein TolC
MVEMDVFSGFATQEKINKAEHQLTAAKESARQNRLQIENDLKAAQLKLQEALHRAEVSNSASQAAEEALRLVNQQRQAGVVTVSRYLETQVALEKALSRQVSARFDALRAEAALKQAIGTWQ